MEEIANQVFVEQSFTGIVTAALKLPRGLLIIDSPSKADERKTWQQKLVNLGLGAAQVIVLLDTHPDRLMNAPLLDAPVLVQENALEIIHNLPIVNRPLEKLSEPEPDPHDAPQTTRWSLPDLSYSRQVNLYWGEQPVVVSHQPGAHLAASWVKYDTEKVIFVGDSVVVNQPPFLSWCSIDRWIEELMWLSSDFFKYHLMISGRDGIVSQKSVENMIKFLQSLKSVVSELLMIDDPERRIEQESIKLLKFFNVDSHLKEEYQKRLTGELNQLIKRIKTDQGKGDGRAGA